MECPNSPQARHQPWSLRQMRKVSRPPSPSNGKEVGPSSTFERLAFLRALSGAIPQLTTSSLVKASVNCESSSGHTSWRCPNSPQALHQGALSFRWSWLSRAFTVLQLKGSLVVVLRSMAVQSPRAVAQTLLELRAGSQGTPPSQSGPPDQLSARRAYLLNWLPSNASSSSVMSVCFARFHPNLVVGGTYSGQIVLWDNRSHRRTPVQRTPLSAAAHTESMELVYNKSKPVAVTGMAFPTGDVNNYVVGSEEGTVYTACRHGSKAGIGEMFEGHQGPVTGISCHTAVGPIDFSHLFVTSSFDWTVKLWTTKHNKPLYSFEDNADYVYDVMWSPVHPALFACVDGMGRLDLWNLNNDTEVPTASVTIEGASALNRVRWAATGKEVAVGDSEGRVWIYDVGELTATTPQAPGQTTGVTGSAHRYHPCADSGGAKMNTRCPPKRVPSAVRFFKLCRLTVQPPQSYSVGGQCSCGQLRGKPTGARPDYRGRWCALAVPHAEDWTRFARTLMEIRANRADAEEEGAVELSN
ncbi:UNVERIFIED_CONTAM: hypothetical protein FKN15_022083 [Acipenser sinensis]